MALARQHRRGKSRNPTCAQSLADAGLATLTVSAPVHPAQPQPRDALSTSASTAFPPGGSARHNLHGRCSMSSAIIPNLALRNPKHQVPVPVNRRCGVKKCACVTCQQGGLEKARVFGVGGGFQFGLAVLIRPNLELASGNCESYVRPSTEATRAWSHW